MSKQLKFMDSLTRPLNCSYLDIGAHTGIFNIMEILENKPIKYILMNLFKKLLQNHYNLKLNNLDIKDFLEAISNTHSIKSFSLNNLILTIIMQVVKLLIMVKQKYNVTI